MHIRYPAWEEADGELMNELTNALMSACPRYQFMRRMNENLTLLDVEDVS